MEKKMPTQENITHILKAEYDERMRPVFIKQYDSEDYPISPKKVEKWERQRLILQLLANDKIVTMYTYKSANFSLIFEWIPGMNLFDTMLIKPRGYSEEIARFILKQILSGIKATTAKNYSHMNIRLENMMVNYIHDKKTFTIKLIDFAFSHNLKEDVHKTKILAEQSQYYPPEYYLGKDSSPESYDVFAVGVALFALVFRFFPCTITAQPKDQLYSYIYNEDYEQFWSVVYNIYYDKYHVLCTVSNELRDLINMMLSPRYPSRYSLSEIENDPWVNMPLPQMDYIIHEFAEINLHHSQ